MKRLLAFAAIVVAGLTILWSVLPVEAQTNILRVAGIKTPAIYDDGAEGPSITLTGSTVQAAALTGGTFDFLDFKADLTLPAPAAPTLGSTFTSIGTCRSDTVYFFGIVELNASGITQVGQTFSWQPSSGNSNRATIVRPALSSGATAWTAMWCRNGGGETCNIWRYYSLTNIEAPGTASVITGCSTSATQFTNTNTTGLFTAQSFYEGLTTSGRKIGTDIDDPRITPGTNLLSTSGTGVTFSLDSGVTNFPLMVAPALSRYVCKAGCLYSTVQSAVDSITDATSTKRYSILIGPGDYDEEITMKSYISLVGSDKQATRLRGESNLGNGCITVPADVTEIGVFNLTTSAFSVDFITGSAAQTTAYLIGNIFGIDDASDNPSNDGAIDGIRDFGTKRTIYSIGNVTRSHADFVVVGTGSKYYGAGNTFVVLDPPTVTGGIRVWRPEGAPTGTIREIGSTLIVDDSTANNNAIYGYRADGTSWATSVLLSGVSMVVNTTSASRSASSGCVYIGTQPAGAHTVILDNFRCAITAADANSAIKGVQVIADADHSATAIQWNGGSSVVSGGATRFDIDNAETAGGFTLEVNGVRTSGLYTGAGQILGFAHHSSGKTYQFPIATAPATCVLGEQYFDTSGADCVCKAANTWEITNATGSCV